MDKDKSLGHGGGFLPPTGRYSGYSPTGNVAFNVKSEPASSSSSLFHSSVIPGTSADCSGFSHDISKMPDNPPRKRGHRRAHSEILTLPDDISFESDLGVVGGGDGPSFSDDTEEDLLSMYLDMDKFNSSSATSVFQFGELSNAAAGSGSGPTSAPASGAPTSSAENIVSGNNERPRIRHQHSQSMDGSTTIKSEMLVSGSSDDMSSIDSKKAMSAAKLAELALIDPKRAKRIWANRQSAARSKERKMRYIAELERKVQTLQTEATSMSAQLTLLQRDTNGLNSENSELKLRLQTMEQQVRLQDALNDALKEEIQHLKLLTGQAMPPNGRPMMNFTSFGGGQQFYPSNNHGTHTLLAAQQFQQLQIHPQQQQHQFQRQQQMHQQQQQQQQMLQQQQQQQQEQQQQEQEQQHQQSGDLKMREATPPPCPRDNTSPHANPSESKDC
ncbi:PREDICTED: probable transcription factor PosF21 isoform X2 [Lupinus angustifolius]|uniref:probable transcription factor PosF21 isoform X1 n=1 Tax=Lupinus angustifolius TaxID=3871 RepID=UPI00092F14B6|nr:PREDICTED: probable transcription factor PosF21 isoform X1 [Lupinus angustifolius]XP_019448267.1 PREDICTED: probable transcription factor PosF21 isoform X2 [Lupinus angustifolius]XP_019448268.1 PREDICTED: probable transcription factor PosF21 isoform X2 [Lupinus angustifolius]